MLTKTEEELLEQIYRWEKQKEKEALAAENLPNNWCGRMLNVLPRRVQIKIEEKFDQMLFHMNSIAQSSSLYEQAKKRILALACLRGDQIQTIADLKKIPVNELYSLAEQVIAAQRFSSFIQGGISGTGQTLLLSVDLPAVLFMQMRAVQTISLAYGYEVNSPYEMMLSLNVFHCSMLPAHAKYHAWKKLKKEAIHEQERYFYNEAKPFAHLQTGERFLQQIIKLFVIKTLKKGLPAAGILFGGAVNYHTTKSCIQFAHKFYQFRLLTEKNKHS